VTDCALAAIARRAKARGTGTRSLRSIMEALLTDVKFHIPSMQDRVTVVLDAAAVEAQGGGRLGAVRACVRARVRACEGVTNYYIGPLIGSIFGCCGRWGRQVGAAPDAAAPDPPSPHMRVRARTAGARIEHHPVSAHAGKQAAAKPDAPAAAEEEQGEDMAAEVR
jgi:hypothetical protein